MILHGDCLEKLKELDSNSIDSIVTDPPYGLSFMGKKWDYDVPSKELWIEVLRVLKPGGHLLSFAGTRTYHRMACNIEDAGFEIRDQIMWLYGSGFPKSTDVGKRIDKEAGAEREVIGKGRSGAGETRKHTMHSINNDGSEAFGGDYEISAPSTEAAKQWQGWGSALKPANEPIVVARKPLEKGLTLAQNVLKYGTGALNIDASRIEGQKRSPEFKNPNSELGYHGGSSNKNLVNWDASQGRWPANVLLDEEAAAALDEQSGESKSQPRRLNGSEIKKPIHAYGDYGKRTEGGFSDSGGASRFFYVAKASKRERNAGLEGLPKREAPASARSKPAEGRATALGLPRENFHPTVKPIKLMEYLIKLVTQPGGVVLDPFMGSGTTGVAAKKLGFKFIGIERELEYKEIAERRVENAC